MGRRGREVEEEEEEEETGTKADAREATGMITVGRCSLTGDRSREGEGGMSR
jgi:hypothetical protein